MISKEKIKEKGKSRRGFGSKWTPDIRNFLIGAKEGKVESCGPNLPFRKGKLLLKFSESQSQEGGGEGDIENKRESLPPESDQVQPPQS